MSLSKRIHVVAAVIENASNEILIAKRPEHVHQGGLWEFPGGKVESRENALDALKREIHEELDLNVINARPLIQIHHDYPDKAVFLDIYHVSKFSGLAHGKEGQPIRWVQKNQLSNFDFPAANKPIISAAQLPEHYLITPEPDLKQRNQFLDKLESNIASGFRLVQLRAKNLTPDELFLLYLDAKNISDKHDAMLVVNTSLEHAQQMQLNAVHLSSHQLLSCKNLPDNKIIVAASCHNIEEIKKANLLDLDFIVLSPVKKTKSHPEAEPLGWYDFEHLSKQARMPVYALGGLKKEDLHNAWNKGAQGIAGISLLWK